MRDLFLLDPDVAFLNHGSFGATPLPVFEAYQAWQRELERQPVEFIARRLPGLLDEARARLAAEVGADSADLAFATNATSAMNAVARSLALAPGDEVLATDREYGAVDILWSHVCERSGARYVRRPLETLWDGLTERTRVLSISHVASPTAEIVPVGDLCARARRAGVLSVVDGAHGPGHVPVDLGALGADAYAGNCHKWLSAPKGGGFLWVRRELQNAVEPTVLSWGPERGTDFGSRHTIQGTRDPAAWLAVPAAIDFQAQHGWEAVRARCHALAERARAAVAELTGVEPLEAPFAQMVACPLPPCDPGEVQRRLYDEHRVEAPVREWEGRVLLRLSFQGYNDESDLERLLDALQSVTPSRRSSATFRSTPPA